MMALGGITVALMMAVVFVSIFNNQQEQGSAAFLQVEKKQVKINEQIENTIETPQISERELATLDISSLDKSSFSDEFNRSLDATKSTTSATTKANTEIIETPTEQEMANGIYTSSEEVAIPFDTLEFEADWIEEGEQVITIAGQDGLEIVYYEDTYENDVLISRIETGREVIIYPIKQEVAVGASRAMANVPVEENVNNGSAEEVQPEVTTKEPAPTEPAPAPTQEQVVNPPASSDIQFVAAGSYDSAFTNHALIAGLLKINGNASYYNFSDNGNNTITVDGVTFAYDYATSSVVTGYDGVLLNSYRTASGMPTSRGVFASVFTEYGGYPFGTVLFIEGFGLGVVGDRNGMGQVDASWLDVCYNNGEIANGSVSPGRSTRTVYVLSTP